MVLVTNISGRMLFRRHPGGYRITFDAGETKDIGSKRLVDKLAQQPNAFRIEKSHLIPPKTGRVSTRKTQHEVAPKVSRSEEKGDEGQPESDSEPKGKGLNGKLPKEYYKLGLSKGWKKFKEDRARAEVSD